MKTNEQKAKVYIYKGIDPKSYNRKFTLLERELSTEGRVTLKDVETGARRSMGSMEFSHFYDLEVK
jgi:hypothetical protein